MSCLGPDGGGGHSPSPQRKAILQQRLGAGGSQEGLGGEKPASGFTRTQTATSGQLLRMAEAQQHLTKWPGPRRVSESPWQGRLGLERPRGYREELRRPTAAPLDRRQEGRFKRQTAGSPPPNRERLRFPSLALWRQNQQEPPAPILVLFTR